jgi:hypothetical protein
MSNQAMALVFFLFLKKGKYGGIQGGIAYRSG